MSAELPELERPGSLGRTGMAGVSWKEFDARELDPECGFESVRPRTIGCGGKGASDHDLSLPTCDPSDVAATGADTTGTPCSGSEPRGLLVERDDRADR